MFKSFFLVVLVFCLSFQSVLSQEVTMEKTVNYLNEKFKDKYSFEMKNNLTVEFIKNSVKYRTDKVNTSDLDPNLINYIPVSNVIKMECIPGSEECFTRWIYKGNIKRYNSRLIFSVEGLDSTSIVGVEKALKHMVVLSLDPKYKLYEFFE